MHKIDEFMRVQMQGFQKCKINIAVAGRAGVGKSSLINTLLDRSSEDKQAASVATMESVSRLAPYDHPDMPNVVIWELPGCDSLTLNRDIYMEETRFTQFDAVILCFSERFSQSEVWLLKAAQRASMPVYVVRTKIDQDLANDKLCRPRTHDEVTLLRDMRCQISESIMKEGISPGKLFFISTWIHHQIVWDYAKLNKELIMNTPVKNMSVIHASLKSSSMSVISDMKENLLKEISERVDSVLESKDAASAMNGHLSFYVSHFGLTLDRTPIYKVDQDYIDDIVKELNGHSGIFPLKIARVVFSPVRFVQSPITSKIETYEKDLEEAKRKIGNVLRAAIDHYVNVATNIIEGALDNVS